MGRIKQIRMLAGIINKNSRKAMPLVALAGIGIAAIVIVIGDLLGLIWLSSRSACCSASPPQ